MSDGAAIVLQARMGSSRLPGKSLALIGQQTLVARCVDRLRAGSGLPLILATTTRPEDDLLASVGKRLGVAVVRGPVEDVLARFVQAVSTFSLDEVVRATADNPAVDMDAPRRVLDLLRRTRADYVVERGLPFGAAVEAVSADALRSADTDTDDAEDREHVTRFIRRDRRFVAIDAIAPGVLRRPDLRVTVNQPEDLAFMRRVFGLVDESSGPAPLAEIMAAADRVSADQGFAHETGAGGQ